MNIKAFFVEALGGALELGIGTPDDVFHHVTPDLLARHLPRPLWARLFTACLGAPRVDAQLVIETIGVPNLCEHLPGSVIWACIAEIGARSLGQEYVPTVVPVRLAVSPVQVAPAMIEHRSVLSPPPEVMTPTPEPVLAAAPSVGPSIPPVNEPLADLINELEKEERPITPTRSRTPTNQRFRQSSTSSSRLAVPPPAQARRPQAVAAAPADSGLRTHRRGSTEVSDHDAETEVHGGDRDSKRDIPVDDSQLVEWQSTETTQATDEDFSDIGRKR